MSEWKETDIGQLPIQWDLKTVDEIKSSSKKSIISGPFGSNISAKYFVDKGVAVIRGNNLSLDIHKRFKDDGFVFITEAKANELGTWAEKDDIIFTAVGTIGQVGILLGNEIFTRYIISNKQLRLRVDKHLVEPLYAYYWFASPFMIDMILQRNTGSSVPLINLSVLKSLLIPIPPKEEQIRILNILSSLDDKIDLLHRQNTTLEKMAETLFRQWFVEEAKEDWEEGTLSDEFDFTMGQSPLGTDLNDKGQGTIFYQGRTDFGFRFPTPRIYTTAPTRLAKPFETLVSVRAPVGDMNMAYEDCCLGRGVAAFRYKTNHDFYSYTYYKLRSLIEPIKRFEDNGSVFGSIGKEDFKNLENILPPKHLVADFQKQAKPLDDKVITNTAQIRTLTALRDTLLPKLMSGEVRVSEQDL